MGLSIKRFVLFNLSANTYETYIVSRYLLSESPMGRRVGPLFSDSNTFVRSFVSLHSKYLHLPLLKQLCGSCSVQQLFSIL